MLKNILIDSLKHNDTEYFVCTANKIIIKVTGKLNNRVKEYPVEDFLSLIMTYFLIMIFFHICVVNLFDIAERHYKDMLITIHKKIIKNSKERFCNRVDSKVVRICSRSGIVRTTFFDCFLTFISILNEISSL